MYIPPDVQPKLATGGYGRDQEVPELSFEDQYDPFKVDIFILGNVFRKEVLDVSMPTTLSQKPISHPDFRNFPMSSSSVLWRSL